MRVEWLGRVGQKGAVAILEAARARVLEGERDAEVLYLCEHDPVVTLGRGARADNVLLSEAELASRGVAVSRTSRGGDVTYHGPGQLMIYPVARVRSVVGFLAGIAGALAEVAAQCGVAGATWRRDPAGLWIDRPQGAAKLAACGIHLRRGVAIHGFALNVSTDDAPWRLIVPCGLADAEVTSLSRELGRDAPPVEEVARLAAPPVVRAVHEHGR